MNFKSKTKRLIAVLLVTILLAGNIPSAENVSQTQTEEKVAGKVYNNGTYEYEVLQDGKSVRLLQCIKAIKEKARKVTFPQKIDGFPVKRLGTRCMGEWRECLSVIEITIPDGIECIDDLAFHSCHNLEKVSIGDDVLEIGGSAFLGCKKLKSVKGGKKVKKLGAEVFGGCKKLAKAPEFWSKSKKKIEYGYAFFSGSGLKSVTIPRWESEVVGLFCYQCDSLRKVIFTGQIVTWRKSFEECRNLREVKFCPGLISITDRSFRWCDKLEEITLPNTLVDVGWKGFQHCRSLKKISLPNSLKSIYHMAFQDCRSLKQITFPKKLKLIEKKAFQGCKNLKKVVIPKSVKKIHKTAFSGCKKLVIHCQKGSYAHKYAKKYHIKYQIIK